MRFPLSTGRVRLAAVLGATVVVPLCVAAAGSGAPPALKQKEAQAQSVLDQVNALGRRLDAASEQYHGAAYRLAAIEASRRRTAKQLVRARQGYRAAERVAAARIVAIYESGEPTVADALLGASSVTDILDRIQAVQSTTALDRQVAQQVATLKARLTARAATLATERRQQAQTVAQLKTKRDEIQSGLRRQNALLASIRTQVTQLRAEERARQARLLAAARARLAAEQAAAEARAKAELERERAAQERAAAEARARAAAALTTTAATTATPPPTTTDAAPPTTTPAPTTTTAPTPTPPTPTAGPGHPQAASIALRYLGVPYVWGGASPSGFDCSGLVMYVYAQLGISLPHYAAAQYQLGSPVARGDLQPGDLVFFNGLDHVGIYIGGGEFVDAPHTGDVVKIETFTGWNAQNYVGARRI